MPRDSFDRDIAYLRISVTDRCNLRCVYCMPPEGVPTLSHGDILRFERIEELARAAVSLGFRKIRLTGGEPLVRRGIVDLVSILSRVEGLGTLAMTTNGTLLAPLAAAVAEAGLDSVNVSLDTLDADRYREITRGGKIDDALEGIEAARLAGLRVKINVVAGAGNEGDTARVAAWARGLGMECQTISRYSLRENKRDGEGTDRPPPCERCDRIRLLADGSLRPCLHSGARVDARRGDAAAAILEAIRLKPLRGGSTDERAVSSIGG